jgi:hypothetical protein
MIDHANGEKLEEFFTAPEWSDASHYLSFDYSYSKKLVDTIETIRGRTTLYEGVREVFRCMNMPGFRASLVDFENDPAQTASSFAQRVDAIVGRMGGVVRSLAKLKTSYSRRDLYGVNSPFTVIARVIRAQWRLAAARDASKAKSMAEALMTGDELTRRNYRSLFARAAADALDYSGALARRDFRRRCANYTARSAERHFETLEERNGFVLEVREAGLSNLEDIDDDEDLRDVVTGVVEIAAAHSVAVSMDVIWAAYEEVRQWTVDDLQGIHHTATAVSRYRRTRLSRAPEAPPLVEEPASPDAERAAWGAQEINREVLAAGAGEPEDPFDPTMWDPTDIAMWIATERSIQWAEAYPGTTVEVAYSSNTATREDYEAWIQGVHALIPLDAYVEVGYSFLPRPAYEGDDFGSENEWVG